MSADSDPPNSNPVFRATRWSLVLELASGAYGKALPLIDSLLAKEPDNRWAMVKRKELIRNIETLAKKPVPLPATQ